MATFVVTTSTDEAFDGANDANDGNGLSLREALGLANTQSGTDTIIFDATAADFSGDALIRLTQGELVVTDTVSIDASTAGGAVVITGDALGNDETVTGTDITDVAASLATTDLLADNSRLFKASGTAALSLTGLTLTGGRTTEDDSGGGGIFTLSGSVSLTNSTLSGNSTAGDGSYGGGVFSVEAGVTLTNSTLSGNSTTGKGAYGGAIFSFDGVLLTDSTVSGNSTFGDGAHGGGIYSRNYGVTLTNSTVSGNSTIGLSSRGGGISSFNGVSLTNSTISGNSTAGDGADGGGLFSFGNVYLTSSTISGNSIAGPINTSGGGIYTPIGTVSLTDSIVLGNSASSVGVGDDEIRGAFTLTGGNIVGGTLTAADGTTQQVTAAQVFAATEEVIDGKGAATGVQAGVLGGNGGPTETILILATGAAQDTGQTSPATAADQRGEARPSGPAGDLGAVELQQEPRSLVVTTASDVVDAFDGKTSLREAIAFANTKAGPDTITFDAAASDFSGDALIRLTQGELEVTDTVSIDASTAGGAVVITGDALGNDETVTGTDITDVAASLATTDLLADNSRLFNATGSAALSLTGLVLTGGRTTADGAKGGGISSFDGRVTLTNSTLSGNSTSGNNAFGGGIYSLNGGVYLTNSTLNGNSTTGDTAIGGGLFSMSTVFLTTSTVSGNSTSGNISFGGGIYNFDGGVRLTDSIVMGNTTTFAGVADDEIGGALWLTGGNIVGDTLTAADGTTQQVTAAQVFAATEEVIDGNGAATGVQAGVLRDNGGPTETILILAGGAAQDAGQALIATDQRGEARPSGAAGDLGAVELQQEPRSLVVTTASDVVDAFDGKTSLREAIAFANTKAGPDTITFDAAASDFSGDALIRLTQGELVVTDTVSIDASTAGGAVVITGDALGNDATVIGTDITDIAASLATTDLLADNSRIFNATGTAALSLTGLTLTGGRTVGFDAEGGAIRSADGAVTLSGSTISGNSTASSFSEGGGVFSFAGPVSLINSTVSDNSTTGDSAPGGGVFSRSGDLSLSGSTISGNSAAGDFSGGGGIYSQSGRIILFNSTVSGNSTVGLFAEGGGIRNGVNAVTLISSTVSGNSTAGLSAAGGGIAATFGTVTLTDSIVMGNAITFAGLGDDEVRGALRLTGGNIVGGALTAADGTTQQVTAAQVFAATEQVIDGNGAATGVQAGLLGGNDGPTETIMILAGGAAQDTGRTSPATAADQRGEARPVGTASDLGAVELQSNNTPPQAFGDQLFTDEDLTFFGDVFNDPAGPNDFDADGDTLTVVAVNGIASNVGQAIPLSGGGLFTFNSDGTYSFDPNGSYNSLAQGERRIETVTYTISDGRGGTASSEVLLEIIGSNDPAVISGDTAGAVTEDAVTNSVTGILGVSDVDSAAIVVSQTDAPGTYGSLSITAAGAWTYTLDNSDPDTDALAAGDEVADVFTVQTADGTQATISININGANDPALINGDTSGAVTEDAAATTVSGLLFVADIDGPDAYSPSNARGTYGGLSINAAGAWTYMLDNSDPATDALAAGDVVTEDFTVQTVDQTNVTITITVNGANDPAVITGDTSGAVTEDAAANTVSGLLFVADIDGPDNFSPTNARGTYGGLSINAAGAWTYTLDNSDPATNALAAGDVVTEDFTVQTIDETNATISITVDGANDPAVIGGDMAGTVTEDGTLTAAGMLTASDVDSPNTFIAQTDTTANHGSYSIDAAGAWAYALDNSDPVVQSLATGEVLNDTLNVQTADGTRQAISITINGADEPVALLDAMDDSFTLDEDTTVLGNILKNDTGPDQSALRSVLVNSQVLDPGVTPTEIALSNGSLLINWLGDFSFAPDADFNGVETFTYTLRDGSGSSDNATVTITVNPLQDDPVAKDDFFEAMENTPIAGNILANDSDADGDPLRSVMVDGVVLEQGREMTKIELDEGTLEINRFGDFTYLPKEGFSGEESFVYQLSDGSGGADTATVTLVVEPEEEEFTEGRTIKLDFRNKRGILNEKVDEDGREKGLKFRDDERGAEVLGEGVLDRLGGNGLSLFELDNIGGTSPVRVHKPEGIGIGRDRVIDDEDILRITLSEDQANGGMLQFGNPQGYNRDGDLDAGESLDLLFFHEDEFILEVNFTYNEDANQSLRFLSLEGLDGFDDTVIFDEIHLSAGDDETEFTIRDITFFTVEPQYDLL